MTILMVEDSLKAQETLVFLLLPEVGPPGRLSDDLREDRLLQDQGRQLEIGVCYFSLHISENDNFGCDVLRPLNFPDPVDPILVGVDPYSPCPNA